MKKEEFNQIFQKYFESDEDSEFFDQILDALGKIDALPKEEDREFLYQWTAETIERNFDLKKLDLQGNLMKFFNELAKFQEIAGAMHGVIKAVNKTLEGINETQKKGKENLGLQSPQSN